MIDVKTLIGIVAGILATTLVKVELHDAYFIWYILFRGIALLAALFILSICLFPGIYKRLMGAHALNLLVYLSKAVPHLYKRESSVIRFPGTNCGMVNSGGKFLVVQYRAVLLPQMTGRKIILFKTMPEDYVFLESGTVCPPEVLLSAWNPEAVNIPEETRYILLTPLEGYALPYTPANLSMARAWIVDGENKISRVVNSDQQIWP